MAQSKKTGANVSTKVVDLLPPLDVVGAVEAIRFSDAQHVILVLPSDTDIFQNAFDCRLLQQIAHILDKQVTLVTTNTSITRLAEQHGLAILAQAPADPSPAMSPTQVQIPSPALPDVDAPPVATKPQPKPKPKVRRQTGALLPRPILFGLGSLGVVAAIAGVFVFWPHRATIEIRTNTKNVQLNLEIDLSQTKQTVDVDKKILPLEMISFDKKIQRQITATGDASGSKAQGYVDIYNCHTTDELVINTDTVFTKDNRDFVLPSGATEIRIGVSADSDNCTDSTADNRRTVRLEAVATGDEYNLEPGSFVIQNLTLSEYNIRGKEFTGGESATGCVTEADLKSAEEELSQLRNDSEIKTQLIETLQTDHNLIALPETFQVAQANIIEPPTCPQVTNNQISQVLVYYLGGVRAADVDQLVQPALTAAANGLSVINNGLETAEYSTHIRLGSDDQPTPTVQQAAAIDYYLVLDIYQAKAGVVLDEPQLIEQIQGLPASQAGSRLRNLDGVRTVDIRLSPLWRNNLPSRQDAIDVKIDDQDHSPPIETANDQNN